MPLNISNQQAVSLEPPEPTSHKGKWVRVTPSKSGNGFVVGRDYVFFHDINELYTTRTRNKNRSDTLDALLHGQTAHLWDGTHWDERGYWKVLEVGDGLL